MPRFAGSLQSAQGSPCEIVELSRSGVLREDRRRTPDRKKEKQKNKADSLSLAQLA